MPRPKYTDLKPGDFSPEAMAPWAAVELKFDGLFARFIGGPDGWSITGRNGAMLRYGHEPCPECYLHGEFIDGTEWASGSEDFGRFVAWNCVYSVVDGPPIASAPGDFDDSAYRLKNLSVNLAVEGVDCVDHTSHWPIRLAKAQWDEMVIERGWEGLVFRSLDGKRYGRMKRVVTMDYICMGYKTQGPRVTALYGGLYIDGRRETVCTVPVRAAAEQARLFSQTGCIGFPFEAKGNAVLASGALRHPRQAGEGGAVKWRADKAPGECVL